MQKGGNTYSLTNIRHTVLYIVATSCLDRRLYEHQNHLIPGFKSKFRLHKLIYYERHKVIEDVIARKKLLKGKTRAKKLATINSQNSDWHDLVSRPIIFFKLASFF